MIKIVRYHKIGPGENNKVKFNTLNSILIVRNIHKEDISSIGFGLLCGKNTR
jgi:hypothetical protein